MSKENMKKTMGKIANAAQEIGLGALDAGTMAVGEARQRIEDEKEEEYRLGYDRGRKRQLYSDIESVVDSYLFLKVKDEDIYELLSEFFQVDSRKEASEFILESKIKRQKEALRKRFFKTQVAFWSYEKSHKLEQKLRDDPKLLTLPPEKLKAILDKEKTEEGEGI